MDTLYVIKVGGNIIDNEEKLASFLNDFAQLKGLKVLIHGGGKIATEISKGLGIEAKMVDGRRITDTETLKIVTMVYAGLINKNLVAKLQAKGCNAIGLTGADANIIPANKRPVKEIDYGFVGDVDNAKMNGTTLSLLLKTGLVPILAPLTHDQQGNMLNTNADTIASSIAVALSANFDVNLIYCFEKEGVLDGEEKVIPSITHSYFNELKNNGVVVAGMIPKLDNAFAAIGKGVSSVYIMHADALPALINDKKAVGTKIS
ncbi:acetylglutamate kinase [Solitalea canadensis]|uniref:Acetylglutamate kinase n=1 Tax=Solitalea canadensis (strain ATCC 29591 / DSM 3403 / JCM 21819 / LMG 8368 / NBRC 15130 / NCIMB 12057 / USAM 9D) TaxID=929556 RepID=H8KSK8_SOLCM|nr:acetylglutamate kinase [Solitalea canadensis]AFD08559.1 acetylglutamate kinase [Solitalea canadensis DSM 3403]